MVIVGVTATRLIVGRFGPGSSGPLDLRVYLAGARAVLHGTPLYGPSFGAASPNHLPFTYPPFAALLMVPLGYFPVATLAWVWAAASVVVMALSLGLAFQPMLRRMTSPIMVLGVLTALALLAEPVYDNLSLGQVDVFLMGACLLGCVRTLDHPGRAALVGLAAAVKVVPAIFVVYLLLARRWKAAAAAVAAWAGATGLGWALRPSSSVQYFGGLLWSTSRPGSPTSYLNQSLWGIVDRADLHIWRLPVLVGGLGLIAMIGLGRAVQAADSGFPVAGAVLVGLVGVMASPISWIHESIWLVLAVGLVIGDGCEARRRWAAATLSCALLLSLPYLGHTLSGTGGATWVAALLVDSYGAMAVAVLFLGPVTVARRLARKDSPREAAGVVPVVEVDRDDRLAGAQTEGASDHGREELIRTDLVR